VRKCGLLGWNPEGMDLPDNHEENGSSGGGRRWALNCRWEFFRADRRNQHQIGAAIILFVHSRAIRSFSPAT
jgi:hypothetical protein